MDAVQPDNTSPSAPRLSKLALVSFVLGLLPLGITNLLAVILSVLSLRHIHRSAGRLTGAAFALAGLIVSLDIAAIGAIAWHTGSLSAAPHTYTNQEEAKAVLRSLYRYQTAHFALFNTYSATFAELDWYPPPWSAYAYVMGKDSMGPGVGKPVTLPSSVQARVTDRGFLAAAVANLDEDPTLDIWTIDERGVVTHVSDDYAN